MLLLGRRHRTWWGSILCDTPVPPILDDTAEVVHIIPQEHLQQRTVDQEPIIAGETTRNIVGFPSVLEQAKIQAIPEVQVTGRVQEKIIPERIEEQIGDIPFPLMVEETVEVQIPDRIQEQTSA